MPQIEPETVQITAYYLWEQRGRPIGSPEADWFRAEEQLREVRGDAAGKRPMVAVAEMVGSALGAVAGLVASVARSEEGS